MLYIIRRDAIRDNIVNLLQEKLRSARLVGILFLIVASALLWSVIFFALRGIHEDATQRAIAVERNLSRNIADKEETSIRSIDLLVKYFCQEWLKNQNGFDAQVAEHLAFLKDMQISQVAVIGKDGKVAYSNIPGWKPVDLSDRQHFKIHKERNLDEMYISAPVLGRVSKIWTIQFTRPLLDSHKNFAGVMVISIPPPALSRYYKDFDLGKDAAIAYVRFGGQILGHSQDLQKVVNVTLTNTPGLSPEDPVEGQYQRKSKVDGIERLYRYHKVGGYPFSVIVGQSTQSIYAQYNQLRSLYVIAGIVATILILSTVFMFISRSQKNEEAKRNKEEFAKKLRDSEEKFRLIAETIDAAVWSSNQDGSYYTSPAYRRIWGLGDEATDTGVHPLTIYVHPDDLERVNADLSLLKQESKFDHEYRIIRPDGEIRWIWSQGFPVRNSDASISRFVGVAHDITELKRIQAEILELNNDLERRVADRTAALQEANIALLKEKEYHQALIKKLEEAQNQLLQSEKMASIGQLAAGVAHEINNPIGFVNSNINTMQQYCNSLLQLLAGYEKTEHLLPENELITLKNIKSKIDIKRVMEDITPLLSESKDGLDRVKRIVQDLKDFSRVDVETKIFSNLEKGLESTINVVWSELKYKAEIVREYADIPAIECVPSQINQVFMNLLVNAAQAIPQRGQITLRTGYDDSQVWIEVADNGSGINAANINKIFEPFFTTKPVGKGTGLGLSLSYSIIKKHGGNIEVSSEEGVGTTFKVTLPRQASV